MRHRSGFVLTLGLILGAAGTAKAQYAYPPGTAIGTPRGYRYGSPNDPSYGRGGYTLGYSRVYAAPAARYRPANPYGFANRPYYGAYGYGNYSNGSTDGFPPFRMLRGR